MNDSSKQVITATMMPEAEIDATAPGKLAPTNAKTPQQTSFASDEVNPLSFFLIFVPILYLGAISIVVTVKLIQWNSQQRNSQQTV